MTAHLDDFVLSELTDARSVHSSAMEHLQECASCRQQLEVTRILLVEARLERLRTFDAPDPWPAIAARTVYREEVRRAVLKSLRLPLLVWTLVAIAVGVVATEGVRSLSREAAMGAWRVNQKVEAIRPR